MENNDLQKYPESQTNLDSIIKYALSLKSMTRDIEAYVAPILENVRGENFEIAVQNEYEIGSVALDEARTTIFAPILSKYSLNAQLDRNRRRES